MSPYQSAMSRPWPPVLSASAIRFRFAMRSEPCPTLCFLRRVGRRGLQLQQNRPLRNAMRGASFWSVFLARIPLSARNPSAPTPAIPCWSPVAFIQSRGGSGNNLCTPPRPLRSCNRDCLWRSRLWQAVAGARPYVLFHCAPTFGAFQPEHVARARQGLNPPRGPAKGGPA